MSEPILRAIFETRLQTWADARDLAVAFENFTFDPPQAQDPREASYLKAFLLPAQTQTLDLAGDTEVFTGLFQIGIFTAVAIGHATASGIAEDLKLLFPNNSIYTHASGFGVQQLSPLRISQSIQSETTYLLPADFRYFGPVG